MSKDLIEGIPAGTIYSQIAAGGGGYGAPSERDEAAILQDVRNGVCSPQRARDVYGLSANKIAAALRGTV
jgi:N-methylhydantoinase B